MSGATHLSIMLACKWKLYNTVHGYNFVNFREIMEMLPSSWLDGVVVGRVYPRRGLLCTNGGGLTGAMDWRFTVYLQLSIRGLSMARPPSLLICIFFLGDTAW